MELKIQATLNIKMSLPHLDIYTRKTSDTSRIYLNKLKFSYFIILNINLKHFENIYIYIYIYIYGRSE